jgi:hypothetical protein
MQNPLIPKFKPGDLVRIDIHICCNTNANYGGSEHFYAVAGAGIGWVGARLYITGTSTHGSISKYTCKIIDEHGHVDSNGTVLTSFTDERGQLIT